MFLRDSQTVFSAFAGSMSHVATLRRKRRNSTVPNPKKMFEEVRGTTAVSQGWESCFNFFLKLSNICFITPKLKTQRKLKFMYAGLGRSAFLSFLLIMHSHSWVCITLLIQVIY